MRSILMATAAGLALVTSVASADPDTPQDRATAPAQTPQAADGQAPHGSRHDTTHTNPAANPDKPGRPAHVAPDRGGPAIVAAPTRPAGTAPEHPQPGTAHHDQVRPWNGPSSPTHVPAASADTHNAHAQPGQESARRPDGIGTPHEERRAVARRNLRKDLHESRYKDRAGHAFKVPTNDRVRVITSGQGFNWSQINRDTMIKGCPAGLAKNGPGCTPPSPPDALDRAWERPGWYLKSYDRNERYRYSDGYMLQLDNSDSVLGYMPLLAGALSVGQIWPSAFASTALPAYYDQYYGLGPSANYRYYDDTLYRVNPQSQAISAIAALLTGNTIAVGQKMPAGYDIYNVPFAYRDQYVDGPDALYRYSDGHIYQLDPATHVVRAAIELLS